MKEYKDGVYEGEFQNGIRHGRGVFRYYETGDVYIGQWANDNKNGKGKYTWKNGDTYDG